MTERGGGGNGDAPQSRMLNQTSSSPSGLVLVGKKEAGRVSTSWGERRKGAREAERKKECERE